MTGFSIIIPLYNKEKTIRSTLESVLRQDHPLFEVIVVDDGSTDGSTAVVHNLSDARVRLFQKENGGPGSARNAGIAQARHDWVIWLDADDLMLPDALRAFTGTLDMHPEADMVVGNFELAENNHIRPYHTKKLSATIENPFKSWYFKELMPCAGTYCCKKTLLLKHPYHEKLKRSEDTEVLFHLFREACIVRTDAVVMRYCRDFSAESRKKTDLSKDFQGHLDFSGSKSLWERICLYELYVEAKNNYPDEVDSRYPNLKHQLLLKSAYHVAFWARALRK